MPSGIFSATITAVTNGTLINAPDVMASLNSLKANGVNNDGALIQTDGSGNIVTPVGQLRGFFFITPYQLTTNPTVNSGTTTTLSCTGGSTGVPSGAIAVLIATSITSGSVGAFIQMGPHGATLSHYPQVGNVQVTNQFVEAPVVCPVDGGGQIDVHANNGNIILQSWYIYGYII